jgi:hypothetical protein
MNANDGHAQAHRKNANDMHKALQGHRIMVEHNREVRLRHIHEDATERGMLAKRQYDRELERRAGRG